jgi:eukaryotic-like serine/threonine-protein kinase
MVSEAPPTEPAKPRQKNTWPGELPKDRYLIEKKIGQGAIGATYRDTQLHRKFVVIKFLLEAVASNEWFSKKFQQEIEALARINHRGIVGILDTWEVPNGKMFLVLPLINGSDLRSVITKRDQ